jgi:hypothetical protein
VLAGVNAGHIDVEQSSSAGSLTYFFRAPIIAQMIRYPWGHAMVGPIETNPPQSDHQQREER